MDCNPWAYWLTLGFSWRFKRTEPFGGLDQPVHLEWLADIVIHTKNFGVSAVAAPFVARDHDDLGSAVGPAFELFQNQKAALFRHHHVHDDEVGRFALGDS